MATDAAREARLGALLSSLGVGDGKGISRRALARTTGFSRGKVDRFFDPIEPNETRTFTHDTAQRLAAVLPVDIATVQRAIDADTRYVAATDGEALGTVLSLLPRMDADDLARVLSAATQWFTGVRESSGDANSTNRVGD